MLDKDLMTDCVSTLMQRKNFFDEVKKSSKCKAAINNLCAIDKATNVPLFGGICATGISSLCTFAGYLSQNPQIINQMGDISKGALIATGVTLGVKYLSKFATAQVIKERSNHEGQVLSYIRGKYIREKCGKENVEMYSERGVDIIEEYCYDISDYVYDNKKEFDVIDFVKDDLDSSEM